MSEKIIWSSPQDITSWEPAHDAGCHEFTNVDDALNQAHLAIDEYYNGDRVWAEQWLLRAYEANQKDEAK